MVGTHKIAVIGLGYVGLPLASALAKRFQVVGFDINKKRIKELNNGFDSTNELSSDQVSENLNKNIIYTDNEIKLAETNFYIVTVPTPINKNKTPNLNPVISASKTVAKYLKKGAIVVFESTVYPGVTEDICVPILEKGSRLKYNDDFFVGYSPERINPGDKEHTVTKIKKVVSASSPEALDKISELYGSVITAGVYEAESIKVAEAAKVIENAQRDINIAFVNELSVIFEKMGIDTNQVLKAAGTKWNFLNFFPGLVGGHCIGVDPYYLAHKSKELGYNPEIILSGRRMNDNMPIYLVSRIIKKLLSNNNLSQTKTALILGAAFKENCPDLRNSKVYDIYNELLDYNFQIEVYDPVADFSELSQLFKNSAIDSISKDKKYDVLIIAVSHKEFLGINPESFINKNSVVFDVKGMFPEKSYLRL
ncbi:MAG: Vi polysaccharide biosynthesis protein VipA/TviB [Flavobacteriales bacterium]|nr:Vi polysaccharide biosynthesis protein VipA/TviB [Flavobacteriales bacterium]|tara:strand:- start:2652 stop:3920 length:1269 start_codon:yes stop_codon:yes gene_type:complete